MTKNLKKYDLTRPKVSKIHSHLDLKSLSFSTESTKQYVRTIRCTPAASQTRKQTNHLVGLRGDRAVHARTWAAAGATSRLRRRSPCRVARCTDLCRQGSFLLQRVFFHYDIKEYLHYNILNSPFLLHFPFLLLDLSLQYLERFFQKKENLRVRLTVTRPIVSSRRTH
jgi:hypothetical protein